MVVYPLVADVPNVTIFAKCIEIRWFYKIEKPLGKLTKNTCLRPNLGFGN